MQINILSEYTEYASTDVDLPDGKTIDDIETVVIKYIIITIYFKDGTSIELNQNDETTGDYKYPNKIEVREVKSDA